MAKSSEKLPLGKFGQYLVEARREAGIRTQQDVATWLKKKLRRPISQGLLAKYETGRVADPDPAVLHALAELYKRDYMELVGQLVREKYEQGDEWTRPGLPLERWNLWNAGLQRFNTVGGTADLEHLQLHEKVALVRSREVLGVEGILKWIDGFPNLQMVWVIVQQLLDNDDARVLEFVAKRLKEGVNYWYFIAQEDERVKFSDVKVQLAQKVGQKIVDSRVNHVVLADNQMNALQTDHVIANAHRGGKEAVGFQYFRHLGKPETALRMDEASLSSLVLTLKEWAIDSNKHFQQQIFRLPASA